MFEPGNEYIPYYVRLGFHSQFPWEAFDHKGAEAMQYCLTYGDGQAMTPNIILYGGMKDGVLYRKEYFDFRYNFQGKASIALADFPVTEGMVRVDKMRVPEGPFELTMGAYGMAEDEDGTEIQVEEFSKGSDRALVLKKPGCQLALTIYGGWESLAVKRREGVDRDYEYGPCVMIASVLTRSDDRPWSQEELFPVERVTYTDEDGYGAYGPVTLHMRDGRVMTVDYEGLEGRLCV